MQHVRVVEAPSEVVGVLRLAAGLVGDGEGGGESHTQARAEEHAHVSDGCALVEVLRGAGGSCEGRRGQRGGGDRCEGGAPGGGWASGGRVKMCGWLEGRAGPRLWSQVSEATDEERRPQNKKHIRKNPAQKHGCVGRDGVPGAPRH